MKKTYIAPASLSLEIQCGQMLALSLKEKEDKDLSSDDFGEDGDFEYNSSKKGFWETEW